MSLIILSPHLDDAVLSCGQALAAYPGSTVITLFAGLPPEQLELTEFDRNCGFDSGVQAISARREEDKRACTVLDATPVHLPFYDSQYRSEYVQGGGMAAAVHTVLEELDWTAPLLIPMGFSHPDHRIAHNVGLRVADRALRDVYVYEELPARVLWPEEAKNYGETPSSELVAGPLRLKQAAIGCYRSQLWALDEHCCLVPERFWRL